MGDGFSFQCVQRIVQQGLVCRLETESECLVFRHDRVRDYLLSKWAFTTLSKGDVRAAFLEDPYYANIVGRALCLGDLDESVVDRVAEANPLALFYTLHHFREPRTGYQKSIVTRILEWCRQQGRQDAYTNLRNWASTILAETDSTVVHSIVEQLAHSSWWLACALFMNGSADAGVWLHSRDSPGILFPQIQDPVPHAARRGGNAFRQRLHEFLGDPETPEERLVGALHLVGFLGEPSYAPAIKGAWKARTPTVSPRLLSSFIWAAARCGGTAPEALLRPMFHRWRRFSDQRPDQKTMPVELYQVVMGSLEWAFARHGIPLGSLRYVIGQTSGKLIWPLSAVLRRIDHPEAIEHVVRLAAKRGAHWSLDLDWRPDEWHKPLGEQSRLRLRAIFEDPSEQENVQSQAFWVWRVNATVRDVEVLRRVPQARSFYRAAVETRTKLGDVRVVPELIEVIREAEYPDYYWWHADRVWCEELEVALDRYLAELPAPGSWNEAARSEDHWSSELLMKISTAVAEQILVRHWPRLRYLPSFIQAALFLDSQKTRNMADTAISECPEPKRPLTHISMHWQMWRGEPTVHAGISQLEALTPYLDLLESDGQLEHVWAHCNQIGAYEWRRQNLDRYFQGWQEPEKNRVWRHRNEKGAIAILDNYMRREELRHWDLEHWLDDFEARGDGKGEAMRILAGWLQGNPVQEALTVACKIVEKGGRREDLAILNQVEALDLEVKILKEAVVDNVRRRSPPT